MLAVQCTTDIVNVATCTEVKSENSEKVLEIVEIVKNSRTLDLDGGGGAGHPKSAPETHSKATSCAFCVFVNRPSNKHMKYSTVPEGSPNYQHI